MTAPYQLDGPWLSLRVLGDPIGQGNIRHLGKGRPAVHQNAKTLKPWRERIQHIAQDQMIVRGYLSGVGGHGFPIVGLAVAVDLTFTVRKPLAAPKRRTTWPITRPDVDHLLRAVLDALTAAGVWRDDSQVVQACVRKTYPGEHPQSLHVPGVQIYVYTVRPAEVLEPTP